jgi:beta-N-acetylhexosaminidase
MKVTMTPHAPLILDIAGTRLSEVDRQRLRHPMTGGLILFGRNWQDRQQLGDLCAEIKSIRPDALICVDHEGGRVQRFRTDGLTHLPPMRVLGEMWMQDDNRPGSGALRAMRAATACGQVLALELRACGVDFSFTPVLDLDFGSSGVIGDRAFHRDPRVVTVLAQSVIQGLLSAGMASCGKHFPGHGFVRADSHTEIPVDRRSLKAILAEDAWPYDALGASLASVMPAHVIYPKVDAKPAGFSARWLQDILRHRLGFEGAIFSDDLSMEGARRIDGKVVSYTEAGVAALQAGCDLVLLCNQSMASAPGGGRAVDELLDGLAETLLKGHWSASEASERRRLALLPTDRALGWNDLMVDARYLQALNRLP